MLEAQIIRIASLLAALLLAGCGPKPAEKQTSPPPARAVVRAESRPEQVLEPPRAESKTIPTLEIADDPEPPAKFRPPDQRPVHNDAKLAAAGIHRYESKRLILYSDIDPEIAKTLPAVVDRLYDALVDYFGPLPHDEQGREFQMTGYLMRDESTFRELGLLNEVTTLHHGLHRQNRFWMREQNFDYYRRHLLLHECTHCYMTYLPGVIAPVWYLEGMAELFGTHRVKPDGRAEFRMLPTEADDVSGWARIAAIRQECAEQRSLTVGGVTALSIDAFFKPEAYAWSWGLCHFFDAHPRYTKRFRELGRHLHDGEFDRRFREAFGGDERNLSTEWTLYEFQLQPGYDTTRAAIEFQKGKILSNRESLTTKIHAARGWQDAGLRVEAGQSLEMTAEGRFTLASDPKPWISEPQGISFRYVNGMPLGRLVACLDADPTEDSQEAAGTHLLHIDQIGKSARLTMPANGRLLLRLNDAWYSLADNEGSVEVTIRRAE